MSACGPYSIHSHIVYGIFKVRFFHAITVGYCLELCSGYDFILRVQLLIRWVISCLFMCILYMYVIRVKLILAAKSSSEAKLRIGNHVDRYKRCIQGVLDLKSKMYPHPLRIENLIWCMVGTNNIVIDIQHIDLIAKNGNKIWWFVFSIKRTVSN